VSPERLAEVRRDPSAKLCCCRRDGRETGHLGRKLLDHPENFSTAIHSWGVQPNIEILRNAGGTPTAKLAMRDSGKPRAPGYLNMISGRGAGACFENI